MLVVCVYFFVWQLLSIFILSANNCGSVGLLIMFEHVGDISDILSEYFSNVRHGIGKYSYRAKGACSCKTHSLNINTC